MNTWTDQQREGWNKYQRGRWANSGGGGPPSVQRRERIRASLLDSQDGKIRCPQIIKLGFFLAPNDDPLEFVQELLAEAGFSNPEAMRDEFTIPAKSYICRPAERNPPWPCKLIAPTTEVLQHALMLGLCTAQVYDPRRPVIWTRSSLSRRIDLFDPEGFYA